MESRKSIMSLGGLRWRGAGPEMWRGSVLDVEEGNQGAGGNGC